MIGNKCNARRYLACLWVVGQHGAFSVVDKVSEDAGLAKFP